MIIIKRNYQYKWIVTSESTSIMGRESVVVVDCAFEAVVVWSETPFDEETVEDEEVVASILVVVNGADDDGDDDDDGVVVVVVVVGALVVVGTSTSA